MSKRKRNWNEGVRVLVSLPSAIPAATIPDSIPSESLVEDYLRFVKRASDARDAMIDAREDYNCAVSCFSFIERTLRHRGALTPECEEAASELWPVELGYWAKPETDAEEGEKAP